METGTINFWVDVVGIVWFNVLCIVCLHRTFTSKNDKIVYVTSLHSLVCMICNICTIAKLGGRNMYIEFDGRYIDWTRYLEWTLCCPLLISEICVYGGFSLRDTAELVCFCLAFNMAGVLAAFSNGLFIKVLLGVQGTVFYLCMEWLMWRVWKNGGVNCIDSKARLVVLVNMLATVSVWPLYIVFWCLGSDMFAIISINHEFFAESIASFILKTIGISYAVVWGVTSHTHTVETRGGHSVTDESQESETAFERFTGRSLEALRGSLEIVMSRGT